MLAGGPPFTPPPPNLSTPNIGPNHEDPANRLQEGKAKRASVSWGQGKSRYTVREQTVQGGLTFCRGENGPVATAWDLLAKRKEEEKERKKLATGEKKYSRNTYKAELEERIAHAGGLSVN